MVEKADGQTLNPSWPQIKPRYLWTVWLRKESDSIYWYHSNLPTETTAKRIGQHGQKSIQIICSTALWNWAPVQRREGTICTIWTGKPFSKPEQLFLSISYTSTLLPSRDLSPQYMSPHSFLLSAFLQVQCGKTNEERSSNISVFNAHCKLGPIS